MSEKENLLPANTSNEPVINIYEKVLKAFINKLAPEEVYAEAVGRLQIWCSVIRFRKNAPHRIIW